METLTEMENVIAVRASHVETWTQWQCVKPIFNLIYYQIKSLHALTLLWCVPRRGEQCSLLFFYCIVFLQCFMVTGISRGLVHSCANSYITRVCVSLSVRNIVSVFAGSIQDHRHWMWQCAVPFLWFLSICFLIYFFVRKIKQKKNLCMPQCPWKIVHIFLECRPFVLFSKSRIRANFVFEQRVVSSILFAFRPYFPWRRDTHKKYEIVFCSVWFYSVVVIKLLVVIFGEWGTRARQCTRHYCKCSELGTTLH